MPKWIRKAKIEKNGDLWMELYHIVESFYSVEFLYAGGKDNEWSTVAARLAKRGYSNSNIAIDIKEPYSIKK
jgi:hypothetical protein